MKTQTAVILAIGIVLMVILSVTACSTYSFAVTTNSSSSTVTRHTTTGKASSITAAQHNTTTLQSGNSQCDNFEKNQVDFLWTHVYTPSRLIQKIPCITVTGVVNDNPTSEEDGDTHFVLTLDANQPKLSQPTNCQPSNPGCNYLIVEIICHNPIDKSRTAAIDACYNSGDHPPYHSAIKAPAYNQHVIITGRYVLDTFGGRNWGEIHPAAVIKVLPGAASPSMGATKQSAAPVKGEE